MKLFKGSFLIISFMSFFSCKTGQALEGKSNIAPQAESKVSTTPCSTVGSCKWSYYENKALVVKKDDIGKVYYNMVEDKTKSVVHFIFKKENASGLADGNYSEEMVFEMANDCKELVLADEMLHKIKLLLGKHSFKREEVGIHWVEQGLLKIKNEKDKLTVEMDVKIPKQSFFIEKINFTLEK